MADAVHARYHCEKWNDGGAQQGSPATDRPPGTADYGPPSLDRLRDIEIFVAIAQTGSLASAGRRLGISAPAVSRALGRLEDRLGTTLALRTSRRLTLTPAGEAYARRARHVVDAFEEAQAAAIESARALRGTLTITAPLMFGRVAVAPALADFCAFHGEVTGRLVLVDRVARFLEEGIDLGVRVGQLPDSSLLSRRLGTVRQRLVASPAYVAQNGAPRSPGDLHEHRLIAFTPYIPDGRLRLAQGRSVAFAPARLEVDCAATAIEWAKSGAGIVACYSYQSAEAVEDGSLIPLLEEHMPAPVPVQLVWPERRYESPLVRAFVDHAVNAIAPKLGDSQPRKE